jgi:hypothetical protein
MMFVLRGTTLNVVFLFRNELTVTMMLAVKNIGTQFHCGTSTLFVSLACSSACICVSSVLRLNEAHTLQGSSRRCAFAP